MIVLQRVAQYRVEKMYTDYRIKQSHLSDKTD